MGADTRIGAFRILSPRATVHSLHGPMADGEPLWPEPYRFAVGSAAFDAALAPRDAAAPTARWEHGLLVEVDSEARRQALGERWGTARVEGARVAPPAALPVSEADQAAVARFATRGWQRPLVRAFEHTGCKAAWLGLEVPGALGEAMEAARRRPRLAVLEELLSREESDPRALWVALERADRRLDAESGGASWLMGTVPAHCTALWPLRNLMRRADREGLVFVEMRFSAYEALEAFVPELPLVCLDREIYGGGFDHDLFHRLCPVPRSGERLDDELGLLAIEAMAQAFNGLVLDARHEGPAYDGHATWQGHSLFEALERGFELPTLTQQLAAFRVLALVCHPELKLEPRATWRALLPEPASGAAPGVDALVDQLTARYSRYVRLDQGWLRGLHARYETELFAAWRPVLADRLGSGLAHTLAACDALVHDSEDLDLRRVDVATAGQAAHGAERLRQLVLKTLELAHLSRHHGRGEPAELAELAASGQRLMGELRQTAQAAWAAGAGRSVAPAASSLRQRLDAQQLEVEGAAGRLRELVDRLRGAQAAGELSGPEIPEDFATSVRELFHGVYYAPPQHIGADDPGAPP